MTVDDEGRICIINLDLLKAAFNFNVLVYVFSVKKSNRGHYQK